MVDIMDVQNPLLSTLLSILLIRSNAAKNAAFSTDVPILFSSNREPSYQSIRNPWDFPIENPVVPTRQIPNGCARTRCPANGGVDNCCVENLWDCARQRTQPAHISILIKRFHTRPAVYRTVGRSRTPALPMFPGHFKDDLSGEFVHVL
jgi:hypothetical protein